MRETYSSQGKYTNRAKEGRTINSKRPSPKCLHRDARMALDGDVGACTDDGAREIGWFGRGKHILVLQEVFGK